MDTHPADSDSPLNPAPRDGGSEVQKGRLVRLLALDIYRRARRLGEKTRRITEALRGL